MPAEVGPGDSNELALRYVVQMAERTRAEALHMVGVASGVRSRDPHAYEAAVQALTVWNQVVEEARVALERLRQTAGTQASPPAQPQSPQPDHTPYTPTERERRHWDFLRWMHGHTPDA